jgi:hypothetical protein
MKQFIFAKATIIAAPICLNALISFAQLQKQVTQNKVPVVNRPNPTVPTNTNRKDDSYVRPKPEMQKSVYQPTTFNYTSSYNDGSLVKRKITVMESKQFTTPLNNTTKAIEVAKPKVLGVNKNDIKENGRIKHCVTKTETISANNIQQFGTVFASSNMLSAIYPGAMYHYDDFYKGIFNRSINDGRNPMTITSNNPNLNGRSYEPVGNPNISTLHDAVRKIFSRHPGYGGAIGYDGFSYNVYCVESAAEMDFALNAGGHYMMVSASNSFSSKNREYHRYLVIDGVKNMFTLTATQGTPDINSANLKNMVPLPQGTGLLKDPSKLSTDLVYINSVTYGARVIAVAEIDTYSKEIADKFSAGAEFLVAGGSADISAALKDYSSSMRITYYSVGGDASSATTAYSFSELQNNIRNLFSNTDFNNARPISYSLANINNDPISSNISTDQNTATSCYFDGDWDVTASISNITRANQSEASDLEIYGQVWAQCFDANGKEIFPSGTTDRMFDVLPDQHLNNSDFINFNVGFKPNNRCHFIIPSGVAVGAKIIVYYWFMDKDVAPNGDDILTRIGGNGEKRKYKNGLIYDAREFKVGQDFTVTNQNVVLTDANSTPDQFVDRDGESGIKVRTEITGKIYVLPLKN